MPLQKTILITSGTTFTVPADFGILVAIEAIGAGGGTAPSGSGTCGGGGGAYSAIFANSGISIVPGQIFNVSIGARAGASTNGGNTWLSISNSQPTLINQGVLAVGGRFGDGASTGAGGSSASCVGTTRFSGGNSGNRSNPYSSGGGSAGGPQGNGFTGGSGNSTLRGGGGGGGTGSAGASTTLFNIGGTGGFGFGGATGQGGVGANANTSIIATSGTIAGSGGGGGAGAGILNISDGANGSSGLYWTDINGFTAGPGGGGGGSAQGDNNNFGRGGFGGLYGGGSGGSSSTSYGFRTQSGQGVLVFTYITESGFAGEITNVRLSNKALYLNDFIVPPKPLLPTKDTVLMFNPLGTANVGFDCSQYSFSANNRSNSIRFQTSNNIPFTLTSNTFPGFSINSIGDLNVKSLDENTPLT
jgi:hypothetical protein